MPYDLFYFQCFMKYLSRKYVLLHGFELSESAVSTNPLGKSSCSEICLVERVS